MLFAFVFLFAEVAVSLGVVAFIVATFLVVFCLEAVVEVVVVVVFFALRIGLIFAKISKSDSSESVPVSLSFFDFVPFLFDFLDCCSESEPENILSTFSLGWKTNALFPLPGAPLCRFAPMGTFSTLAS